LTELIREGKKAMDLVVGPILGFRGSENGEWHTCALIVTPEDAKPPKLRWSAEGADESDADCADLKLFDGLKAWRFDWGVEQTDKEQKIEYALTGDGASYAYNVPAKDRPPRIAYTSCAGFHDPKGVRDIKGRKNAMWEDLAQRHREQGAYHLMVMGGDQVYADQIWEVIPQLKSWIQKPLEEQEGEELTEETMAQIGHFYSELYSESWGEEETAWVMSRVPALMTWDDHDIFDGWGSRSTALQNTRVYEQIYEIARDYFRLFQLQANDDEDLPAAMLLKRDGGGERKNLTYTYRIGNDVALAMLDMRSERTRERVMGPETWEALRGWMRRNLNGCKHLLVVSSIPVVYVDANMLEGTLGLVPGQQDLEDDFRDQWQSRAHLQERLNLIHELFDLAKDKHCRATIVSGDVHLGALGHITSELDGRSPAEANAIVQLISSPLVNTPLSGKVIFLMEKAITLMGILGRKGEEVDRGIRAEMLQLPGSNQHFIKARNWLSLELDERHRICARWYAEDKEVPYTKVVHPINVTT